MNFEELALIPASQSFRRQLGDGIARIEREAPASMSKWNIFAFDSLSSTMDLGPFLAVKESEDPAADKRGITTNLLEAQVQSAEPESAGFVPAIILSAEQHRGRGRDGRSWLSTPRGGLYVTFVVAPKVVPQRVLGYSLGIGLAVTNFLEALGVVAGLKWPNDVLVRDSRSGLLRKLAGILIEMSGTNEQITCLSAGIGLNLNQQQFPPDVPGISLAQILGGQQDYVSVFSLLAHEVSKMLEKLERDGFSALVDQYNSKSLANGSMVRINNRDSGIDARVIDIAPDGGLRVAVSQETEPRVVYSGELDLEGYVVKRK